MDKKTIKLTFIIDNKGTEKIVDAPLGLSILEIAHANHIDLEGACEGSLACATCHIIVQEEEFYNKLEKPKEEEEDMLDLAFELTHTSRLGCQIIIKPELDGMKILLPNATRNINLKQICK